MSEKRADAATRALVSSVFKSTMDKLNKEAIGELYEQAMMQDAKSMDVYVGDRLVGTVSPGRHVGPVMPEKPTDEQMRDLLDLGLLTVKSGWDKGLSVNEEGQVWDPDTGAVLDWMEWDYGTETPYKISWKSRETREAALWAIGLPGPVSTERYVLGEGE